MLRAAPAAVIGLLVVGCFPDPKIVDVDVDVSLKQDSQAKTDTSAVDTSSRPDTSGWECERPADCGHLKAQCVKVLCLEHTCATQPDTGAACDDGDPCTEEDTCVGSACVGSPYSCDDGVPCTEDLCDGAGGCDYPAKAGTCHIGAACFVDGEVKADDPCRICLGGEAWAYNEGAACEDGDEVCTLGDRCEAGLCVSGDRPVDTEDWAIQPVKTVGTAGSEITALAGATLGDWACLAASFEATPLLSDSFVSSQVGAHEGGKDSLIALLGEDTLEVAVEIHGEGDEYVYEIFGDLGEFFAVGRHDGATFSWADQNVTFAEPGAFMVRIDPVGLLGGTYIQSLPNIYPMQSARGDDGELVHVGGFDTGIELVTAAGAEPLDPGDGPDGIVLAYMSNVLQWYARIVTGEAIFMSVLPPSGGTTSVFAWLGEHVVEHQGGVSPGSRGVYRFDFDGTGVLQAERLLARIYDGAQQTTAQAGPTVMTAATGLRAVRSESVEVLKFAFGQGFIAEALDPHGAVIDVFNADGASQGSAFIAYDDTGDAVWTAEIAGASVVVPAVAAREEGVVMAASCCVSGAILRDGSGDTTDLPAVGASTLVAAFDADGALRWWRIADQDPGGYPLATTSIRDGSVLVGGYFGGTVDFGEPQDPLPVDGTAVINSFVWKLNSNQGLDCSTQ